MEAVGVTLNTPVVLVVRAVAPLSRVNEVPPVEVVVSTAEAPAQMVALLRAAVGRATTDTDTVAVVKQPGPLVTVTVNVLTPVGKPVAVAAGVVAPVNVTPAGPTTAYV